METQIWSKTYEKWAYILVLRGSEVSCLKITGNMLTLKRNVKGALDALQQGQNPSEVSKATETLDARTISKAEVSPGNNALTLHGSDSKKLTYTTGDSTAPQILQAILAQSGHTFQPMQEEIGVVEALIPPVIVGAIGGAGWFAVYDSAGKMAAGENVEVKGFRRRGLQRMLIGIAETLGTGGTIAVGVLLLALIGGWAAMRIIRRPERTVWLPESAAPSA
jgi:hypothetical protein